MAGLNVLDSPTKIVTPRFDTALREHGLESLARGTISTLQVNVGKLCNQACHHCHVEASPKRTEIMSTRVAERVVELMSAPGLETIDLTGGAPELNPNFRYLVLEARARGLRVIDRCNLTVLFEEGQEDLLDFLVDQRVEVVASLPCYTADNVDAQRGRGVFDSSIEALRLLNARGYAHPDSGLTLNLVYNPGGAFLPPAQAGLQARYKEELLENFDITFNDLFTITNMPIKRFAESLQRAGKTADYMELLVSSFNPRTVEGLMCRSEVSIGWDGQLYDCDFNQMLELETAAPTRTVWDIDSLEDLAYQPIATDSHCFGCTAGAGSSCGGALE